jgi:hypothetical protein
MSDDLDRRLRERLGDLDLPAAPSSLRDAVDRLGAEPPRHSQPRWRAALRTASVLAASIVLVAVLAWGSGVRLGVSPGATPSASTEGTSGPSQTSSPTPSAGLATENPRPSGPIVPWLDQSALTAPSPAPAAVPPGTPACLPSDLAASAGWQGGGGQMLGWLNLKNTGAQPCVLHGAPRLVELRSGKATVKPIAYRGDPSDGSSDPGVVAGPVLLAPGGSAGAHLWWSNWCGVAAPAVTALIVTLAPGGAPVVAGQLSIGPGLEGVPRCDAPSAASTFTAYAFTPVAPEQPEPSPQPASAVLSAPPSAAAGADLVYYVVLTNRGAHAAPLDPCPTYSENLVVGGVALKLPTVALLLLNCAAIGPSLAPGASVTLEMHLLVPANAAPGPAVLHWDMDPGGPLDTSSASPEAALMIVAP